MKKFDLITVGLVIIFVIFLIGVGFLFNYFLKKTSIPQLKEPKQAVVPQIIPDKTTPLSPTSSIPLTQESSLIETTTSEKDKEEAETTIKSEKFLKNKVLTFKIYGNKIYFYDLDDKTLKYYDFQNDLIIPIYKNDKVVKVIWGPKDDYFIFKTKDNNFVILDYLNDNLYTLPFDIQEIAFISNNLIAHFKNKSQSYLGLLDLKGRLLQKIIDVNFEEIKIQPLSLKEILIFEKPSHKVASYLWIANLQTKTLDVIFDESPGLFALATSGQILISQVNNETITQIIDRQGKILVYLPSVSILEKCQVEKYIVCAITSTNDIDAWYNFETSDSNNSIFVYNPKTKTSETFYLDKNFDVLFPQLKDNYLYFIDRESWQLYRFQLGKTF